MPLTKAAIALLVAIAVLLAINFNETRYGNCLSTATVLSRPNSGGFPAYNGGWGSAAGNRPADYKMTVRKSGCSRNPLW